MAKRIAISTIDPWFLLGNYGSFFQHYALRTVLKKWGFQPFRMVTNSEQLTGVLKLLLAVIRDAACVPYYVVAGRFSDARNIAFAFFYRWSMVLLFRGAYRHLIGSLREAQETDLDFAILGSDQVMGECDPHTWLMDFQSCVAKIVYAGSTDWASHRNDTKWQEFASNVLKTYKGISVREWAGVELMKHVLPARVSVARTADPVFFLRADEYGSLVSTKRIFVRPTLLVYLVNVHSESELQFDDLVAIADKLQCQLRVIGLQGTICHVPMKYRYLMSPADFIRAYRDADYVLTNSFHGTVFSLLFHKNFVTLTQRQQKGYDQNNRQTELMNEMKLDTRHLQCPYQSEDVVRTLKSSIDWKEVDAIVNNKRSFSEEWLRGLLLGDNNNE